MAAALDGSARVVALQTSRASNLGVPGKNELEVGGRPLFLHNLAAAASAATISAVFAISDIDAVHAAAAAGGFRALPLAPQLAAGEHYGAIRAGLDAVERELAATVDVLVVLLGNSLGATGADLDRAVETLMADPDLDSVCSVSEFNTFNPLRALRATPGGLLEPIVDYAALASSASGAALNRRDALGDVLFFNGSFWVCRRAPLVANDGAPPFPWLGRRVAAARQAPCMEVDAPWQVAVLEALAAQQIAAPGQ